MSAAGQFRFKPTVDVTAVKAAGQGSGAPRTRKRDARGSPGRAVTRDCGGGCGHGGAGRRAPLPPPPAGRARLPAWGAGAGRPGSPAPPAPEKSAHSLLPFVFRRQPSVPSRASPVLCRRPQRRTRLLPIKTLRLLLPAPGPRSASHLASPWHVPRPGAVLKSRQLSPSGRF